MSRPIPPQPAPKPKAPSGPGRSSEPKKGKFLESPWMTTKETAEYAGRCKDTVLAALRRGELDGSQQSGVNGTWRIHVQDVDRWIRGERKPRRHLRSA